MTRYLLAATVVIALGVVVVAAVASASPSHVRFVAPSVCPYEQFSMHLGKCAHDDRATPLTTNRFTCSTTVLLTQPASLVEKLTFDGGPISGYSQPYHLPAGPYPAWFGYTVGTNMPLPGGSWVCTFTVGKASVAIPFKTKGPTGAVVDVAVCAAAQTLGSYTHGICKQDYSAGVQATDTIVCSVYVLNKLGKIPTLEILGPNGNIVGHYIGNTITERLWPVWVYAKTPGVWSDKPGTYSCQVSFDNQVVLTHPFVVK